MTREIVNKFGGPHSPAVLMASREDGGYSLGDDAMAARMMAVRDPLNCARLIGKMELAERPGPQHRIVADWLIDQITFLYLDHRGSYKTSLVDEVGTVRQWLEFPDDRILFLQATRELGADLSRQVRHYFVEGDHDGKLLRELFPEYVIRGTNDAGQVMRWSHAAKRSNTRESSLTIGTPDTALSGSHFDVTRGSDVSNPENNPPPCGTSSPDAPIKLQNWIATVDGLLESEVRNPRAHSTWDGTRWSEVDLWSYLMENNSAGRMKVMKKGIEMRNGKYWSDAWPGDPEVRHQQILRLRERTTMSDALWAANFLNTPYVGAGAMQFHPDWIRYYSDLDIPPEGCRRRPPLETMDIGITVDPAYSEQEQHPESDRSAILVTGVDNDGQDGDLYVLAYAAGQWGPSELLQRLYAFVDVWKPSWGVGIEKNQQAVYMLETIQNEMRRSYPYVPYRELMTGGKNKLVRAIPLHTHANRRGIYFKKGEHDEVVQELLKFPTGKYDDLVDCLAYRAKDLHKSAMPYILPAAEQTKNRMTGDQLLESIFAPHRVEQTPWGRLLSRN